MVAEPALWPVTVLPETEAMPELLLWKLPPEKFAGAEAVEV